MNIPLSWLKEAAKIEDATPTLLKKMTAAGNAVEGLTTLGNDITGVVVGKIVSLERHPDADKLWVTQTDVGTETLQIVTGADNLKVGDYIPVAVHGSTLANGLKIKKGKMRGLDSNGMLCSIDELGYTTADYPEASPEGIYVFDREIIEECIRTGPHKTSMTVDELLTLGADVRPVMQLCEEVAEFDILSNRPDTNSVIGMAREVAAVYGKAFVLPEIKVSEIPGQARNDGAAQASDLVTVEIKDPTRCPRYIARVVKNVKIAPSPQWLRRRLSTAGVRPINNIVDITNYVMLEYGQPLHAFDISAVAVKDGKHGIVVRTANAGEKFTTLDGEERELTDTTLLIADHEKAIGIAGVMGGENSKILDTTTTILFESANFDSANIRQTSRALGMRTDASGRYEKGQDPNQAAASVNRAMELVQLLGCGDVVPGMVDSYPTPRTEKVVPFKPCGICARLGIEPGENGLNPTQICEYLQRVGISTKMHETCIDATIPTYRADITCEADLAEEVARFYGLNNIASRYQQILSGQSLNKAGKTPRRRRTDDIKRAMTALGYNEAMTYPFESPKVYDKLNIPAGHGYRKAITLKNPLGEDFSIMRTVSLGGLLESVARNHNKGNENVALFEIADTYAEIKTHECGTVTNRDSTMDCECGSCSAEFGFLERAYLTMVAYGSDMDFLALKGDVESLLSTVTNRPNVFEPLETSPFMHPGRTATLSVKTSPNPRDAATVLGFLGELHPAVAKNYDIGTRVYVAVLKMDTLHEIAEAFKFKFVSPPVYPALSRDLAFTVNDKAPAADLEAAIREKGGQYLSEVKLFDVYRGAQIGEGNKSMAYALKFRAGDRTLTVPDVQKSLDAILANLQKKFEAQIRS